MDTKDQPQAPQGSPASLPPAVEETVTLVNTGRAPLQILPNKTLLPNSQNTVAVPRELADRLRRAYAAVKNIKDVFPQAANIDALRREHEALKRKAESLEKLLGLSDADKQKLQAQADADLGAAKAQVADLQARLQDFLKAGSKKDLEALQEKHADAVPAAPVAA